MSDTLDTNLNTELIDLEKELRRNSDERTQYNEKIRHLRQLRDDLSLRDGEITLRVKEILHSIQTRG